MGLSIPVIVNSVNNLSDARYAAGMGVEWMGFQVEEGAERYISPDTYKAIISWVSGIKTVAEVSLLSPALLQLIQAEYQPDYIQFEQLEGISQDALSGIPFIHKKMARKGAEQEFLHLLETEKQGQAEYLLADCSQWESWKSSKTDLTRINTSMNILWALPIGKEDISDLLSCHVKGIALHGTNELKPGWNDLDAIMDILEALEEN